MKKDPLGIFDANEDQREDVQKLFKNIKAKLKDLKAFYEEACNGHWTYEDPVYRYYHGSFKVWYLQSTIKEIVGKLESLLPGRPLNKMFMAIVNEGTKDTFKMEFNQDWSKNARPIVEAFFHARFMLEMVIKYGEKMKKPENMLPSGWAAVLYLYDLR